MELVLVGYQMQECIQQSHMRLLMGHLLLPLFYEILDNLERESNRGIIKKH